MNLPEEIKVTLMSSFGATEDWADQITMAVLVLVEASLPEAVVRPEQPRIYIDGYDGWNNCLDTMKAELRGGK